MTDKKKISPHKKYDQRDSLKPNGLWYSFGCEWISWCLSEMKDWVGNYSHEVEVEYENIMVLENEHDVINFQKTYGEEKKYLGCSNSSFFQIDWKKLSGDCSGIEIRNYPDIYPDLVRAENIQRTLWFSSWDVSSGCVWDLSKMKIKSIHRTEDLIKARQKDEMDKIYEISLQNL